MEANLSILLKTKMSVWNGEAKSFDSSWDLLNGVYTL